MKKLLSMLLIASMTLLSGVSMAQDKSIKAGPVLHDSIDWTCNYGMVADKDFNDKIELYAEKFPDLVPKLALNGTSLTETFICVSSTKMVGTTKVFFIIPTEGPQCSFNQSKCKLALIQKTKDDEVYASNTDFFIPRHIFNELWKSEKSYAVDYLGQDLTLHLDRFYKLTFHIHD